MSSRELPRRLALAGALLLTLGLGGCFQPLYGPTASGANLGDTLAAIEVEKVTTNLSQERMGHYLRSELAFDLDGGAPAKKRYTLALTLVQRLQTPIVDTATGTADSATLFGDATYRLTTIEGGRLVAEGKVVSSASYDRSIQRFATVRAARDAEIRLAKLLAEQIRTRIAIGLRADPVKL